MSVKARKTSTISRSIVAVIAAACLAIPGIASAAPPDWQTTTGTVEGGAFGPLAVGSTHTRTDADGRVTGTLMVYGQRGWVALTLTGTRAADGQLHATLGRGRGTGAFRHAIAGGTLDQRADGTLTIALREGRA